MKIGRPRIINRELIDLVKQNVQNCPKISEVSKKLGISRGTIYRILGILKNESQSNENGESIRLILNGGAYINNNPNFGHVNNLNFQNERCLGMTNRLPFEKRKKEILIKAEESTDPKYGCPPENRTIEEHIKKGIINLDKPRGPTSHEVVAWVKRILSLKKAGHGGTLDPNVSGVLPTALEDATKVIQTLLPAGKEYICVMHLHEHASEASIKEVCREFTGTILQKPPIRAAVKRQIRPRKIYYIDVLEIIEKDVLLRVGCEAGTYLRKITHDVGEALGVSAHMAELRRTQTGPFKEDETLTKLHELMDSYHFWKEDGEEKFLRKIIQPLEKTVQHLPRVTVRDSAVDAICHGAHLAVPGILQAETGIKKDDFVAVFTLKNELISLGRSELTTDQIMELNKGIAIRTERVIMLPGTYPRMWGK